MSIWCRSISCLTRRRRPRYSSWVKGARFSPWTDSSARSALDFSLGSLLAVHLAVRHNVAGLVLLSPAFWVRDWRIHVLPIARHLVRFVSKDLEAENGDLADPAAHKCFWSYDVNSTAAAYQATILLRKSRAELQKVHQPTLVVYAVRDQSIAPHSGPRAYQRIGAQDKELLALHQSGHGLVVDSERQLVFQKVDEWISARQLSLSAT